jgi:predicted flavoprotein YhiN
VISQRGLEGGGIYAISRRMRTGGGLWLDLFPDLTETALATRIAKARKGDSIGSRLRKLGLSPAAAALVLEWATRPLPADETLAARLKRLPVPHQGLRPIDEAISVAGGIAREGLTEGLELRALPGIFACGEMLDWEAPTGGYLLTACLATGRHAGRAAARL